MLLILTKNEEEIMRLIRSFFTLMIVNQLCSGALTAKILIESIDQKLSPSMEAEEQVFKASFTEAYKKIPEILKSVGDLDRFLTDAFADEIKDFSAKKSGSYFFHAIDTAKSNKVVGFIGFDTDNKKKSAYIRQLAVDPKYQNLGVGRKLVFALLSHAKLDIDHLEMVTRRANSGALDFYRKLGFNESSFQHEGLDPKVYSGFEWHLNSQILQKPIASNQILAIPTKDTNEELVDIFATKNDRILPLYDLYPGDLSPAHDSYAAPVEILGNQL